MRLLALIRAMLSLRLLSALAALLIPAAAIAEPGDVQTAWRLLDYMAVDYGGAVADGRVKSGRVCRDERVLRSRANAHLGASRSLAVRTASRSGVQGVESLAAQTRPEPEGARQVGRTSNTGARRDEFQGPDTH